MVVVHRKLDAAGYVLFDFSRFGLILNGREDGMKAFAQLESAVLALSQGQKLLIDLSGVKILNPSFADETLSVLMEKHKDSFFITGKLGLAVQRGLEQVERQRNINFPILEVDAH
jgi:hypothetical protein